MVSQSARIAHRWTIILQMTIALRESLFLHTRVGGLVGRWVGGWERERDGDYCLILNVSFLAVIQCGLRINNSSF